MELRSSPQGLHLLKRTSLHYASAHNHPDVVTLLLENKSNINIQDDEGCTPLIKYGLTPLQLATYENQTEMINFLESMSADAQAVQVSNSARRPAHKKEVKHVRFLEEAGKRLTGTSPWCVNVDNVSSTSSVKGESGRKFHIIPKKIQNIFRKSGVYVCSRGEPVPDVWKAKKSIMDEKTKMENFHSVPSEAAADVGPSTSTADSLDAAEPAQNKSTKEAASLTAVEPEPTKSTIAADSLTAVEPAPSPPLPLTV
nr:uncharacterized protein LOC102552223 isoform X2 [Rattus norvegicus]